MSRLYDRSFKVGFIVTISVFVLLNILSYLYARNEYLAAERRIEFIPLSGRLRFPSWGVPFSWIEEPTLFENGLGLVLNVFAIAGCAFVIGLIFRFIGIKKAARTKI